MPRKWMPAGPGRPKGLKNKATILKEERRVIFDKEVSQMFLDKIKEARPEYLLDQFMGKAEDKIDINAKIQKIIDPEERRIFQEILKDAIRKYHDRKTAG